MHTVTYKQQLHAAHAWRAIAAERVDSSSESSSKNCAATSELHSHAAATNIIC